MNTNRNDLKKADIGDLTERKAIIDRLQCKSFKWFMSEVAWDQNEHYPAIVPQPYAQGSITSQADSRFCVEASFTNK